MWERLMANTMKKRFDGYLPVVVDVETGGVDDSKHALLEVAAVWLDYDASGQMCIQDSFSTHVVAFDGSVIDQKALEINQIDPDHPFRFAIPEDKALAELFKFVRQALNHTRCRRAVLVGHNAHFDLGFLNAAMKRCKISSSPFHGFTCFDTATLGGLAVGKTVLAKALKSSSIAFDEKEAHSAVYDTMKTAELFCQIVNQFDAMRQVSV